MRPSSENGQGDGPTSPAGYDDPVTLLLDALVWTLGAPERAERFLALTGLAPSTLRENASAPATLIALARFLADHEPDLLACAEALSVRPPDLITAARSIGKGPSS